MAEAVPTFKAAAEKSHAAHSASFKSDKHGKQWIKSLEADVFPMMGQRTVDDIDSADVLKVLSSVWLTKPETARRVRQRIKSVLDWAKASAFRTGENPVDGSRRCSPNTRTPPNITPLYPTNRCLRLFRGSVRRMRVHPGGGHSVIRPLGAARCRPATRRSA
jgi:integrase